MSELRWPSDGDRYKAYASLLRRRPLVVTVLALAVIGMGMTLYASYWGPWAFSDGVGYLVTARNVVEGRGFGLYRPSGAFIPTVTHPPLFPFLLAVLSGATGDVLQAARLLNALLISVLVTAVPLLFRRIVGLSSLAAVLGLLLITHPGIILMFLSAMSEPLFVVAGTTSLLMICLYLSRPKRRSLALACGFAAAAMLTRYVGFAYIATAAVALLFLDRRGPGRQRLLRAAAYSAAAVLPTLVFVAYWMLTPYARTIRSFSLPPSLGESISLFIRRVAQTLWSWKPVPTPAVLREIARIPGERIALLLILLGLLLTAIAAGRWTHRETAARAARQEQHHGIKAWLLPKVFSLFVAVFLGGMFLAFAFGLPTPDIDSRTLFPLLPSVILVGAGAIGPLLASRPGAKTLHWAAAGLMIAFAAGSLPAAVDIVAGIHRTGLGYTAREWHESETMQFVDNLDPQAVLISNAPEAIMLYTGRSAYPVPSLQAGDSRPLDSAGGTSVSGIAPLICREGGFLALFNQSLEGVDPQADPTLVLANLSCELSLDFGGSEGAVYSKRLTPDGAPR